MSQVLTNGEIEDLLDAIAGRRPKSRPDFYESYIEELSKIVPFTYFEKDTLKDFVKGFVDDWVKNYQRIEVDEDNITYILSSISNVSVNEIIENKELMKKIYTFALMNCIDGARMQKSITSDSLSKILRSPILVGAPREH